MNINDLRMYMKSALDNMWARITGRFDTVNNRVADIEDTMDDLEGDMIKSISLNGVNVPKDGSGNVALQEADPNVPAWAKQAKAKTSDFTNDGDGSNNNSPFATQEYVRVNGGKIDEVQVNGTALPIDNKAVNIHVPTSLDDLDDALYVEISGTATEIHDQLSGLGNGGFAFFKAEHPEMDMLLGKAMPSKYVYGTLVGTIVNCPLPDGTDQYYLNGYYNYYDGEGNEEETGVAVSHFDFTDETNGGYSLYVYDSAIISNGGGGGGGGGSGAVDTVTFNGVTYQPDANGNVSFGFTETDPTVPAWAKAAQKPSYTAAEVGALPKGNYSMSTASMGGLTRLFDGIDITDVQNGLTSADIKRGVLLAAMATKDGNSRTFLNILHEIYKTGDIKFRFGFLNHDGTHSIPFGFNINIAKDGTVTCSTTHPDEIRQALEAKPIQTPVGDPTASGTAVAFIDSITQDVNGVITPTKKTVRSASQSESGLMSATDKAKLDGIAEGLVMSTGHATNPYGTFSVNSLVKWGNIYKINVWVTLSSEIDGVNGRVCDIPANFCPSSGSVTINGFATYRGTTDAIVAFRITSAGTLITYIGNSTVSGQVKLDATYII